MNEFAAIIANGEFSASKGQIDEIKRAKYIIAVDGGIDHCLHAKIHPQLLIGDFDSVSEESLAAFKNVPRVTLLHDKDETDLEAALKKAIELTEGPLRVFCALGKRTDHTLYNLYLLARYPGRMTLESERETLFVLPKTHTIACHPGQTISLLPLNGPVKGVSSQGLKWELHNATFDKNWMSISNICLGNRVEISFLEGDLLCCLNAER